MAEAPDIGPILALLEDARDAGRCMEAAAALRALSQLRPENLQVKAALARALFGAGLWQEAWDAYEVRFDLMPEVFTKVTRPGPNGPEPMPMWRGGALPAAGRAEDDRRGRWRQQAAGCTDQQDAALVRPLAHL